MRTVETEESLLNEGGFCERFVIKISSINNGWNIKWLEAQTLIGGANEIDGQLL